MPDLNYNVLLTNVREAREELDRIERDLAASPKPDEESLRVAFEHAFHHLNFAWNARRVRDEHYAQLSDEDFDRWSEFPGDLSISRVRGE
jgi:hypothetical protein